VLDLVPGTLESYRLTETGIEQCRAANRNIAALAARNPHSAQKLYALLRPAKKMSQSFTDVIRRLDETPEIVEALRAAHLPSRDYLLTVLGISARIALEKREANAPQLPEGLSRDNFNFAQDHPELINALANGTKEMLARVRGAAVPISH
jgi:hypothetical protein